MARSKKQQQDKSSSNGGRVQRRLAYTADLMAKIEPNTDNQKRIFDAWEEGKHMFIYGCAGTGKTFCALYNALKDTIKDNADYDSVYLVRSLVATREVGFPVTLRTRPLCGRFSREMVKWMSSWALTKSSYAVRQPP